MMIVFLIDGTHWWHCTGDTGDTDGTTGHCTGYTAYLASLAAVNAVVEPRRLVSAYSAQHMVVPVEFWKKEI